VLLKDIKSYINMSAILRTDIGKLILRIGFSGFLFYMD
jgi:hypothetical protein